MARTLLLELDLESNGGRQRFYSPSEIRDFVSKEREFWRALNGDNWPAPFNFVNKRLSQLEQAATGGDDWSTDQANAFAAVALSVFLGEQRIPHSSSSSAKLIQEIAETDGLDSARGALVSSIPWANFTGIIQESPGTMSGAMAVAIARTGLSRAASSAAVKRLNGYVERREAQLLREREALDEFFVDQSRIMAELENEQRDQLSDHVRLVAELENDVRNRIDALGRDGLDAIAAVRATDAQFREQMHLKAPSEYWETKAGDHRGRARELRGWIAISTLVGAAIYALVFVFGFGAITDFLKSFADKPAALFIVTGAVAFVLAIPLWFLRILVKFYLSEQHLAADAKERHTMALTYLALANDGKVEQTDRALVLGALFRSGSDGLVKDASGPDASLAGLLSRLLDR